MHIASIIDTPSPRAFTRPPVQLAPAGTAILLNANAKQVDAGLVRALRARMDAEDVFVSRSLEQARAHISTILARGYATLMLGGGDGTISSALQLLSEAEKANDHKVRNLPDLVILKLGTGNALAALAQSGKPLDDVERVLSNGTAASMALRVLEAPEHGRIFPFGSMGYDAQMLNDHHDLLAKTKHPVARRFVKSVGGYVYALATRTVAAEVQRPTSRFRITSAGRASLIDPESGEELPLASGSTLFEGVARAVLVGTTPFYGYGMKVLPHASRRLDRFHLRVSTASIAYLVMNLPAVWKGSLRTSNFLDFLVEDVTVASNQPLPVQLSGDASGAMQSLRVRLSDRRFCLLHLG